MLSQIIRVTGDNAIAQINTLDQVARNASNLNTPGFKAHRFEAYLSEWGTVNGTTRTDESQGPLMLTKRPLDLAIDGIGYFPVTAPDGEVAYTRDGRFTVNADGYVVTMQGDMVGDGFKLPADYEKVVFQPDGKVLLKTKDDREFRLIGTLTLAGVRNPEGMVSIGDNKRLPTEASGPVFKVTNPNVQQGRIERANVDMYQQVETTMRMNTSVISAYRLIRFADELYRQAINLRQ
jgi:flagellar basal-body rod protein FlgG